MILILSGDISLNPGPVYNHHPPNLKEWDKFKIKGLYLLHINVNSVLLKIDERRYIVKLSNAVAIGIKQNQNSMIVFLTQKSKWITIRYFVVTETGKVEALPAM